jgi:phosphonate utilization associated putative membrane protein
MTLTWTVVAAVLLGALLHAGWNAVVKSSGDQELDTAVMQGAGTLVALPLAFAVGWPPAQAWPYIAGSVALHIGYFATLAGALRHGDLGVVYPLMRGTAPLLVALCAGLVLGEALSTWAWAGVLAVSAGVFAMGLSREALAQPRAVGFALANAAIIALYTLVDAVGVRASGNALQYVVALFALTGWPFALLVLARRGRAALWRHARTRWPFALGGAAASKSSYGLALWAMTQAPVATVAALRETSVLFAVLLGWWVLREPFTRRRMAAALAIVAGVMTLRLG